MFLTENAHSEEVNGILKEYPIFTREEIEEIIKIQEEYILEHLHKGNGIKMYGIGILGISLKYKTKEKHLLEYLKRYNIDLSELNDQQVKNIKRISSIRSRRIVTGYYRNHHIRELRKQMKK